MYFENIVGQKEVIEHLKQTIADNRVSHAQLFLGPRGSGTLPLAIAYARAIISSKTDNIESTHLKVDKLIHPDVHFVFPVNTNDKVKKNPTSKLFLNEFRSAFLQNPYMDLDEWLLFLGIGNKQGLISVLQSVEILHDLSLKAYESDYKIMIIWMAEKLHPSAANKLLKILEEPPQKTVFILVAEDQEQILPTILSRTQIVKLKPIDAPSIKEALIKNFGVDEKRAASVSVFCNGNYAEAVKHFNQTNEGDLFVNLFTNWMRLAFKKDYPEILTWIDQMAGLGRERQKQFLHYSLHLIRECLMLNTGMTNLARLEGDELSFAEKFAPFVNHLNTANFIESFNQSAYYIERNANPKILFLDLSLKVMKWIRMKAE